MAIRDVTLSSFDRVVVDDVAVIAADVAVGFVVVGIVI